MAKHKLDKAQQKELVTLFNEGFKVIGTPRSKQERVSDLPLFQKNNQLSII